MKKVDEILTFWFGDIGPNGEIDASKSKIWFFKSEETDAEIKHRFKDDVIRAGQGEYESWEKTAHARLALILLMDQFTRNIYRGTAEAFSLDAKALELSLDGQDQGMDQELHPIQRCFFYLPMEHAEDLEVQERSVAAYKALACEVTVEQNQFKSYYQYAVKHRDFIERFGRFPHRNEILGRPSTPDEIAFLKLPGSSF